MVRFLNKFFGAVESFPGGVFFWTMAFATVIFIRYAAESFAGLGPYGGMISPLALPHYFLWYGMVYVVSALLISWFTKKSIGFSLKLMITLSPMMLFPILFPFIIGEPVSGSGHYFYASNFGSWLKELVSFWGDSGFSVSLRLELLFSLLGLRFAVRWFSKSWIKTLSAVAVGYVSLLAAGSFPSFVIIFQGSKGFYPQPFFMDMFFNHFSELWLAKGYFPSLSTLSFNSWYDMILAGVLFPLFVGALALALRTKDKKFFKEFIANCRPRKGFDFAVAALGGIAAGMYVFGASVYIDFMRIVAAADIIVVGLLFYGAAAFFNDVYDTKTDQVTHPKRLLVSGKINASDALGVSWALSALALLGALTISVYMLLAVALSLLISLVYSYPPLRLKRFFPLNIGLIALVFALFALAGFFTAAPRFVPADAPWNYAGLFLIAMIILSAAKDIPDYEGDRQEGVATLPTLIGVKRARMVIGIAVALMVLVLPAIAGFTGTYWWTLSSVFAVIFFYIVSLSKNYSEKMFYVAGVAYFVSVLLGLL